MVMEFDPGVSIGALAGSYVEIEGGIGEMVCDEEFFDLVLEVTRNPTACPQIDNVFVPSTEVVQDYPPDLRWDCQGERGDVFE